MNRLQSTIFCSAVIVVFARLCVALGELPERQLYLSPFQDAWKSFLQNSTFVLYQRSFEHDPVHNWNGRCIHGQVEEWDHEKKIVSSTVRYWDNIDERFVNRTVYLVPGTTEGYLVPNVQVSFLEKDKLFYLDHPLLVSEYDNCDILRVAHRSNGCEMWIIRERTHEISTLCFFIYDLLCGANKFRNYEEEFCNEKIAATPK